MIGSTTTLLLLVTTAAIVSGASVASETDNSLSTTEREADEIQYEAYKSIMSLPKILCQLFLGEISLCPASSCEEIAENNIWGIRSVLYWLNINNTSLQCNCNEKFLSVPICESNRVGYIQSSEGCPPNLTEVTAGGRKLCAKSVDIGCSSVIFPTHEVSYSKVCGRVYGYQKDTPDGPERHTHCPGCTIDQQYIDGVSITHGSPRSHIWTLAATYHTSLCPCGNNPPQIPAYVGQDYFCDAEGTNTYISTDRLWDGQHCLSGTRQCCSERGGWFCKDLPQPTTDDIEFRVCADEPRSNEDVYIEHAELYIQ